MKSWFQLQHWDSRVTIGGEQHETTGLSCHMSACQFSLLLVHIGALDIVMAHFGPEFSSFFPENKRPTWTVFLTTSISMWSNRCRKAQITSIFFDEVHCTHLASTVVRLQRCNGRLLSWMSDNVTSLSTENWAMCPAPCRIYIGKNGKFGPTRCISC